MRGREERSCAAFWQHTSDNTYNYIPDPELHRYAEIQGAFEIVRSAVIFSSHLEIPVLTCAMQSCCRVAISHVIDFWLVIVSCCWDSSPARLLDDI